MTPLLHVGRQCRPFRAATGARSSLSRHRRRTLGLSPLREQTYSWTVPVHVRKQPSRIYQAVDEGSTSSSRDASQSTFYQTVPYTPPENRPIVVKASVAQPSFGSWLGAVMFAFLITVGSVCAALTAFMLYLRPTLKTFEETCEAAERASKQLESAAIGLEEASIMFDETLPPALKSVEAASREFEELGQSLNSLSGGLLSRRPARHRKRGRDSHKDTPAGGETAPEMAIVIPEPETHQKTSSSTNITRQTMDSISKVASDITSFTRNFRPAMDLWRKRLASIVSTVEANQLQPSGDSSPKQLAAPGDPAGAAEDVQGAMNGVSSVVESVPDDTDRTQQSGSSGEFDDDSYGDLPVEDMFKDKDSLVARFASESTGTAADAIMDALYKAEQAAEDAAQASGDLEEAVKRAQSSGVWEDFIAWGDEEAPLSSALSEFFEPNYTGSIKRNIASSLRDEDSDQQISSGRPDNNVE